MKRVLLTNAIGPYETGWGEDVNDLFAARLTRGQGPFTLKSIFPAFALHLIAENLNADTTILEWPPEELFCRHLKKGYDYLGIQTKSVHLDQVARMVRMARKMAPATKIVLGGYGVNHIFNEYPSDPQNSSRYLRENADHYCFEEGVGFFRKLLGQAPDAPISQVRQPFFEATTPGSWYLVRLPLSSTLVALGCPNACEFCNTSHFFKFKKITVASPEQACASLVAAQKKMAGLPNLFNIIWDEDFLIDRDYVLRLGELLQKEGLIGRVNLFCFASIRSLSQYTVEELARCGVGVLWIGVESKFDGDIIAKHNFQKRIGRDVAEVFNDLHNHGMLIIGSNILGLDFHNHENIIEDIDYFVSLKPDLYQVSPLRPCPGTTLYERLMEDGRIESSMSAKDTMLWSDTGLVHPVFKKGELKKYFELTHKKLIETNGSSALRTLDVMLKGYRTMQHSKDPYLQARADRCQFFARKLGAGLMPSLKKLAPSQAVFEQVLEIEERYRQAFGSVGLGAKAIQQITWQVMKSQENRKPEENPTPLWTVTRFEGANAQPKVVARQHPLRHALAKVTVGISRRAMGLKFEPAFKIKLADIDDFPVTFKNIEIEGHRIGFVDEGSGQTILMLHGNPTWSYLYRHIIADLKADFRCVAPDLLGYGLSDKPQDADYSMEAHVRRLDEFVRKMDLRDITLVCQDWGGIIGLTWASRNKERVARLVPMNTAGFLPSSLGDFKSVMGAWAFPYLWSFKTPFLGKKMAMDWNIFLQAGMRLGTYNTRKMMHKKAMKGYLYPFQRVCDRTAILKSVRQVPMSPLDKVWGMLRDTEKALDGWPVRTRVIWGMKDPVFVPWFIERFEELLPNHAPSLKIPTAGHFLQDDEPDAIIKGIREFLAESSLKGKKQAA